jgi:hypothetical protein
MAATIRRERARETQLGYSLPFPRWREIERLSNTLAYTLLASGEVDSVVIGSRRFVILETWRDYLARQQQQGVERDPQLKAEAARRFAETAERSRQRYAPKHGMGVRIGSRSPAKQLTNNTMRRTDHPSRGAVAAPSSPPAK